MATVTLAGPFLLEDTLRGGQAFRWRRAGEAWIGEIDGHAARVTRTDAGATVETDGGSAEDIRAYVRLDDGYEDQLARLERGPLKPAVARWRGLRLLRQPPWEALAAFIVSANNNVRRIEGILARLADAAGERVETAFGEVALFPRPAAVAALGVTRLRALGCGYRAPFLAQTAARIADGFDLAALRRASRANARAAILDLPGVGPKVADCVLAFGLDHTDSFPVDRHVARAVASLWPRAPTRYEDLAAWARRRWGRDASLAQQFVFHAERLRPRVSGRPPRSAGSPRRAA